MVQRRRLTSDVLHIDPTDRTTDWRDSLIHIFFFCQETHRQYGVLTIFCVKYNIGFDDRLLHINLSRMTKEELKTNESTGWVKSLDSCKNV